MLRSLHCSDIKQYYFMGAVTPRAAVWCRWWTILLSYHVIPDQRWLRCLLLSTLQHFRHGACVSTMGPTFFLALLLPYGRPKAVTKVGEMWQVAWANARAVPWIFFFISGHALHMHVLRVTPVLKNRTVGREKTSMVRFLH